MAASNRWVYRLSDWLLLLGESGDPSVINADPANYGIVDLGENAMTPDPRTQRAANSNTLRVATSPEMTAYDAALRASRFTKTSRQKDVLATCAMIVRSRDIPAWNAMTLNQKKTATFAEADIWVNIRDFAETNL